MTRSILLCLLLISGWVVSPASAVTTNTMGFYDFALDLETNTISFFDFPPPPPEADFYFAYNSVTTNHVRLRQAYPREIAFLDATPFASVGFDAIATATFTNQSVDEPFDPDDTILLKTDLNNYYKIGNAVENPGDNDVTFDFELLLPPLPGDYNSNNVLDAADYTVWRDAVTAGATELLNDPTPGTVDETDFEYWRDHFGESLGAGAGEAASATVPEPGSALLVAQLLCLLLATAWYNRR